MPLRLARDFPNTERGAQAFYCQLTVHQMWLRKQFLMTVKKRFPS